MDKTKNQVYTQDAEAEKYRAKIIDLVNHINNKLILKKIYTVVKTHKTILNEERGELTPFF